MTPSNGRGWLLGIGGLVLGLLVGYVVGLDGGGTRPNPAERQLNATLWMQTSGEYRALCYQTYRNAAERLEQKVKHEAEAGLPPAVVMDLDETVLDNSPYEAWLIRTGQRYSHESWVIWERDHADEVGLVPGAHKFINRAEKLGVAVVYISNREDKYRKNTIRALEHNKLSTKEIDQRLRLKTTEDNKTARRKWARQNYRVLMLVGDNLTDFREDLRGPKPGDLQSQKDAIARRLRKVEALRDRFGSEWIILPNPTYGDWADMIGDRPAEVLRQTTLNGH
jgi:acid phosphatase